MRQIEAQELTVYFTLDGGSRLAEMEAEVG